jgi:urease accessory protein
MVTATATTVATTTRIEAMNSALLQLLWLSSPALPVGAFSYSEALEAGVELGDIGDEASAQAWLLEQLHLSLARSDLSVLGAALQAWRDADLARVRALNDWVLQTRETAELRLQTEQMGKSLHDWLRGLAQAEAANGAHREAWAAVQAAELAQPSYPVISAAVAAFTPASASEAMTAYAFAWSENQVQAAIKSVPLGQSAGQRILAALCQDIPEAVALAQSLDDDSRQSFSPMLALYSAWHETQYSRLFRS